MPQTSLNGFRTVVARTPGCIVISRRVFAVATLSLLCFVGGCVEEEVEKPHSDSDVPLEVVDPHVDTADARPDTDTSPDVPLDVLDTNVDPADTEPDSDAMPDVLPDIVDTEDLPDTQDDVADVDLNGAYLTLMAPSLGESLVVYFNGEASISVALYSVTDQPVPNQVLLFEIVSATDDCHLLPFPCVRLDAPSGTTGADGVVNMRVRASATEADVLVRVSVSNDSSIDPVDALVTIRTKT